MAEALAALFAAGGAQGPPRPQTTPPAPYRSREPTAFRGVTRTSGTNSGLQKFDVQFVFCDNGTKKHPKIYGFGSLDAAARAFDILTCKRALEKGRTVAGVLSAGAALGTNHPASDYANRDLLSFLESTTRDDCIYGLKQCAKKGHSLQPSTLLEELLGGIEAAQTEAAEKRRIGDPRQSYEATAKSNERRRRAAAAAAANAGAAANAAHNAAAASAAAASFQPPSAMLASMAAAAAVAMGQQHQQLQQYQQHHMQPFGMPAGGMPGTTGGGAATLSAEDIVGQMVRSTPVNGGGTPAAAAAMAAMAASAARAPTPHVAAAPAAPAAPSSDEQPSAAAEGDPSGGVSQGVSCGQPSRSSTPTKGGGLEQPYGAVAGAAMAAALEAAEHRVNGSHPAPAAPAGQHAHGNGHGPEGTSPPPFNAGAAAAAAAAAASTQQQQEQQQQHQHQQQHLMLAQLMQNPMFAAAASASTQAGVSGRLAAQGLPLLLEMLRVSSASSQEISCAHDIVRIWAAVQQGQNWAAEQCHLPKQYYQGLLPVLQACPDTASILALTSQLWQSGMLRMLCNAYTASLQQQASALALLQGATNGNAAGAAAGLSQLTSLLAAATGGLADGGPLPAAFGGGLHGLSAGATIGGGGLGGADGGMASMMSAVMQNPGLMQLLGQAGGMPQMPVAAAPTVPPPQPAAYVAAQQQQQQSGRPVRQPGGRGGRPHPMRAHSTEPPPAAKRSRRQGQSRPASEEPPPPPQLQQLLDILSGENPSPRDPPPLHAAAQQQRQHAQLERTSAFYQQAALDDGADDDDEMPDAIEALMAAAAQPPAVFVKEESPVLLPAHTSAPAVSAFAASAAQQVVAAGGGGSSDGPPTAEASPALAAAALAARQRSLSLQRSLSTQLPLPANQPNVRIVPALPTSRDQAGGDQAGGGQAKAPSPADAPAANPPRAPGGGAGSGKSIELTITAAPPMQHASAFGHVSRGGATITTGLNRPASSIAPPVTTGTHGGSGGATPVPPGPAVPAGDAAPAAPAPMVSAFAAAASSSLPINPPPLARLPSGKGHPRPMPQRTLSTPATITTGITLVSPPRTAAAQAGLAPRPSGGLDVLSRAASLQQSAGAPPVGQEPLHDSLGAAVALAVAQPAHTHAAGGEAAP